MKLSVIACALLASSASAFSPAAVEVGQKLAVLSEEIQKISFLVEKVRTCCCLPLFISRFLIRIHANTSVCHNHCSINIQRSSTALNMDRRAAFGAIAAGAAAVVAAPQFASADGAISAASIGKAKAVYGDRIAALKSAVESGNFDAVVSEKSAFVLFNSGAYPTPKDKPAKAAAIEGTNAIFKAAKAGDKAALKSAYTAYVKSNDIKPLPKVDSSKGQGYSGDFDYKRLSPAGAIYVR